MQSVSSNILFVDDDEDSCELMSMMLLCAGADCETTAVATPLEALDLIAQKPFDLLVVDYKLPEMSGVELCRRIRKTDKQTPILFFTGMASSNDRNVAIAAGASSYLVKPNDLDKFTDTVKQLLSEKQSAAF
ncbi:MAG: response regulator [Acidobacteria bacterium]|nr:response regulator [Acidobacteriota bacterium]MCA1638955.1 response regulator [Acidobacteriota bacterium]